LALLYVKWKKRKLKRIWDISKWNDDVDVFIMGHTHKPEALIWVDHKGNIKTYVNTGDWIDHETYVLIKDGNVRLKNYNQQNQFIDDN
jgi:UDP-2,3-diacylglucosamine pyrophosphatase LpxH